MSENTKRLAAIGVILVATGLLYVYFTPIVQEGDAGISWQTFEKEGVSFDYPERLLAGYITPVDWPPQAQVIKGSFACTETGSETARGGKTEKRTVGSRTYCLTKSSEGAAGSVYTQYSYAFPKNGQVVILTFSLRFVQCGNYPELEKKACEDERETFDIDAFVDRMASSLKLKK